MLSENVTLDVTVPFDFATVAFTLLSVRPVALAMLPLKMLVASVTPTGIGPSEAMVPA
jgi:hypothetical protein